MKKRYYNATTKEWYTEGNSLTRRVNGALFSGVPSVEQLTEWGFVEWHEPEPTPEQEAEQARLNRMAEIQGELSSMDYLTSKYIDGEDMTEYGDWQGKRRALREEYRTLENQNQEEA